MDDKQGSFLQNWSKAIIKYVVEMSEPSGEEYITATLLYQRH